MKKWIFHLLLLFVLWELLTWSVEAPNLIAGGITSILLSFLFQNVFETGLMKLLNPVRFFWFIVYIPVFVWQVILSNFDVAYRVLNPGLPIKPGIVKVRTRLKTGIGKTFLANSITLTPGTMTVEIDGEYLYIHWINVRAIDVEGATKEIVNTFEKFIIRIFE